MKKALGVLLVGLMLSAPEVDAHIRPWSHCHGVVKCAVKRAIRNDDNDRTRGNRAERPRPARPREGAVPFRFWRTREREDLECGINRMLYRLRHPADRPASLTGLVGCNLYNTDAEYHRKERIR